MDETTEEVQNDSQENSVASRIMLFNQQVNDHLEVQRINPFSHCSVRDMPKRSFLKEQYGTAPTGSLSEQRALQAQILSLQEILQLCELIHEQGAHNSDGEATEASLKFGELFEMYNHISDKLLGTLICARKQKYIDFVGETLFQGRDDAKPVRLLLPFKELQNEIVGKMQNLRGMSVERPVEHPESRELATFAFVEPTGNIDPCHSCRNVPLP